MMVFYHFLLGKTEDGEKTQPPSCKHLLQVCWLASSKAPPFFIDLRGSSHSHMSRLELQWGKVPKVPRAGSKCSPLAVVHDERRKSRRERAVQREELEWGAKREGNERGTTTENAYVSYGTLSMVTLGRQSRNDCILQTLRTTLLPYFHPFDTDSHGVTSDRHVTAQSRARLNWTLVHLHLS